jgi:hypothetical protein
VRRALTCLALALSSVLALPASAAPPPLACPSLKDATADDRNADLGSFEDPALDILGGSVQVRAGRFVVVLHLRKVGYPTWAEGVQYAGGFRYGLQDIEIFGTIAKSNPYMKSVLALQGIRVDHSYVLDTNTQLKLALDKARGTVTMTMPMEWMARALGVKTLTGVGQDVRLTTAGNYVAFGEPYDHATTFAPLRLDGCH